MRSIDDEKVLVAVATENELAIIPEFLKEQADKIVITGVGGMNVCKALCMEDRNQKVVNVGYCGSNVLPIGAICSPDEVQLYHPNVDYREQAIELNFYVGREHVKCYTSSDFVVDTKIEEPVIFDMELAFIATMGFKDVLAIKQVSDNLSVKEYEENSK